MHCGVPIQVEDVHMHFDRGAVTALQGITLDVKAGEVIALTGSSGSGKSTLLSLIGLLDRPTSGRIIVGDKDLQFIRNRHRYRSRTVGFVFQFHHLVTTMTLQENVMSALMPTPLSQRERRHRARALMQKMGLGHRLNFFPSQVSGGERQRAAIGRALVGRPPLLLADEPTGNLDSTNSLQVMDLFLRHAEDFGATVLIATHSPFVAARTTRSVKLHEGKIVPAR